VESRELALEPDTPLGSWRQLVANVHQSVAELAISRLAQPKIFIIVGDHAPPFANQALRNKFSQTVVPYVLLIPRKTSGVSSRTLARGSLIPLGRVASPLTQTP
jgi:hypothetical protein